MHLRRLIVLIINARNIINPSPLLSSGIRSPSSGRCHPTHCCIGFDRSDQKNQNSRMPLFLPEGVGSNRQWNVSSRCPKIRPRTLRSVNTTKLALFSATYFVSFVSVMHRTVSSQVPRQGKWWSQTGSNRRHPACKAGALPAELWPQT